ncbi:fimbria/pilus outer membrane usher protein [Escherichia coli]|nr:fimbrial biogenesis outer membrane usher protein [Escherichia coli]
MRIRMIFLFLFCSNYSIAHDIDFFDKSLLVSEIIGDDVDLSAFSRKGGGVEGVFEVDVFVNNKFFAKSDLHFSNTEKGLLPDFHPSFFEGLIASEYLPKHKENKISSEVFIDAVPYSNISFTQSNGRVDISIPQAYLGKKAQLKSSPDSWDEGVAAVLLDYRFNGANNRSEHYSDRAIWSSTTMGINSYGWRLRASNSFSNIGNNRIKHSIYDYYAERDIRMFWASLRVGKINTSGMIFDSVPFTGSKLYSNNDMLNPLLRNYSPVVRGMAFSPALVTITQNGRILYQTNVPAGPFAISEISVPGYSGDLYVSIKESDGNEHGFIQSFSRLPEMKRDGISDFEFGFGQYDNVSNRYDDPYFLHAAWSRGYPNDITLLGETIISDKYQSIGAGSTLSLGKIGALSTDISVSRAELKNDILTGMSYGLKYSKSQLETGSTVTLAAYRYSTDSFRQFRDFLFNDEGESYRYKNKVSVNISQSLEEWGTLSISASQQKYWNKVKTDNSLSLSHGFNMKGVAFSSGISVDQSFGTNNNYKNKLLSFSVSVPLNKFEQSASGYLTYQVNKTNGILGNQVTMNGNVPDTDLNYQIGSNWNNVSNSGYNAGLTWNGEFTTAAIGYYRSANNKMLNYSMSGSMVAYPEGFAFGREQVTSGGAIIVQTDGISGIKHNRGGRTTWAGTSLISSPDPYTVNKVELLHDGLSDDIVLGRTSVSSVPVKGAVTVHRYTVYKGGQVIFSIRRPDGSVLPFGAIVSLEGTSKGQENVGIVGEGGMVYMPGVPEIGRLKVSSGGAVCYANFTYKKNKVIDGPITEVDVVCR